MSLHSSPMSWQKIFSHDPLVGYFQQHRNALAKLETLTDPAAIDEQRAIVRNTMIQGTLSIIFLVMVAFVMVCALIRIINTIRNRDTTTSRTRTRSPTSTRPRRWSPPRS